MQINGCQNAMMAGENHDVMVMCCCDCSVQCLNKAWSGRTVSDQHPDRASSHVSMRIDANTSGVGTRQGQSAHTSEPRACIVGCVTRCCVFLHTLKQTTWASGQPTDRPPRPESSKSCGHESVGSQCQKREEGTTRYRGGLARRHRDREVALRVCRNRWWLLSNSCKAQ
jgi:hypothetical protein